MKLITRLRGTRFGFVGLLAAVALIGTSNPSAADEGLTEGAVQGTVTVTPGVPLTTPLAPTCDIIIAGQDVGDGRATEFDFLSTTISGAFLASNTTTGESAKAVAPDIAVTADEELPGTAADEKNCDNGEFGAGTVDLKGCAGDATIVASSDAAAIGETAAVDCSSLAGTFVRVGPLVIVLLTGLITITSPNFSASIIGKVTVAALFVPTVRADAETCGATEAPGPEDPNTNECAVEAEFAGAFVGESATT